MQKYKVLWSSWGRGLCKPRISAGRTGRNFVPGRVSALPFVRVCFSRHVCECLHSFSFAYSSLHPVDPCPLSEDALDTVPCDFPIRRPPRRLCCCVTLLTACFFARSSLPVASELTPPTRLRYAHVQASLVLSYVTLWCL